jgi:antitoxin (DNA-binding transcriptional repressor) of toxin-antitoxin stability system
MTHKSDKTSRGRSGGEKRVSATEASRSFSRILDEVESGARFLIHRRGRDACIIAPPPVEGRRASEVLAYLRSRPSVMLDDAFGKDLLEILSGEPEEKRPTCDS